jgi:hypothetical protein
VKHDHLCRLCRSAGLWSWLIVSVLSLVTGCAAGGTSPFDKTYVAVVYGRVTRAGSPVAGLSVKGDVYTTTCPSSALQQTSTQTAQTEADGRYRLLLTSTNQDAGQCLVLTATGGPPVLHTLDETPFTAEAPGPPTDSLQLDVSVP